MKFFSLAIFPALLAALLLMSCRPKLTGKEKVFVYEDDKIKEELIITAQTDNSISFYFGVDSKAGLCSRSLTSSASMAHQGSDPEIDEDESGVAYPANEYIYKGDDYVLYFRISLDNDKAKVRVEQDALCNIDESVILRIKK